LVADKATKRSFAPSCSVGPTGYGFIQEEGLICRAVAGDNLALCPPLIITEDQIHEMFDRFERGLARLTDLVNEKNMRDVE